MKLIIIAAVAVDGTIGIGDEIPWYIPEDFKHYKETTMGHTLIVGSSTMQSLPKAAHKGRKFLILSRNDHPNFDENQYKFFKSKDQLKEYLDSNNELDTVYIIGGAMVYKQLLKECDEAIITWVNEKYENSDKLFPIQELFANFTPDGNYDWVTSEITGTQYCIRRYIRNGCNETKEND